MEQLVSFQVDVCKRILKAETNFKKSPKERITREYVEARLEALEQLWLEFLSGHKELLKTYKEGELAKTTYITAEVYEKAEDSYMDYKCTLKVWVRKFSQAVEATSASASSAKDGESSSLLKLPKINIPCFSGKYAEWPTFRDLFTSMVHNNTSLDDVQKLHYLKGYLSGEAEQLLRHIPIVGSNYSKCWELLDKRYNNKKYICHQVIKRLLSQKNMYIESSSALKDLIDTTSDCLSSLSSIGVDTKNWDILVIHILTLKLDVESRRQWEFSVTNSTTSNELPTFEQFKEFISNRYRAIEFLEPKPVNKSHQNYNSNQNQQNNIVPVNRFKSMHVSEPQCPFCSENHKLFNCKAFCKQDVEQRRGYVQENNICFNCLGVNHSAKGCQSQMRCRLCKKKHHSLLHPRANSVSVGNGMDVKGTSRGGDVATTSHVSAEAEGSMQVLSCFSESKAYGQVLLATAVVKARAQNGGFYAMRALLDQGSQSSFVTEATVQYLGLQKTPVKGIISGVGGNSKVVSNGMVNIHICSRWDPKVILNVQAYVLNCITSFMPTRRVEGFDWVELKDLKLADPGYQTPNKIDILLGAEVYSQILLQGLLKNPQNTIVAQSTSLGWILSGTIQGTCGNSSEIKVMHCCTETNDMLKQFWELENVKSLEKKILTEEEQYCEEFFKATTVRDETGRYVVRLPLKHDVPIVQASKTIAEMRLKGLERRLKNDKELKESYTKVIKEYLQLGHMELVPENKKNDENAVYLPHHVVIRNDKDTTKVRVVFDASCKGKNGVSLNDALIVGPSLQADLRHIIMRWRWHSIVLVSDIVKMYRQINVSRDDTVCQRILWRDDPSAKIQEFELTTVTFGTASAPYLAVRSLHQLAIDENSSHPKAAEIVKNDYYMDDLLTGADSLEEAKEIYVEMNELMKKGKFELQKWSSNVNGVFQEETQPGKDGGIQFKLDDVMKILGLTWNRSDDTFRYTVTVPEVQLPLTKRKIIADISRFYDPLGWMGPSTILMKMLIQRLWLTGIQWDEPVPENIRQEWLDYRGELHRITEVAIPRWMGTTKDMKAELHGFCDASKLAYAAVVYLRIRDNSGNVRVTLVTAKTKVAPVKQVSIPRLELCGAVMLAKLVSEVAVGLKIDKANIHTYTDSTIVLAYRWFLYSNA